jgi:hypothetical protein
MMSGGKRKLSPKEEVLSQDRPKTPDEERA